jgi:hypothetical protein
MIASAPIILIHHPRPRVIAPEGTGNLSMALCLAIRHGGGVTTRTLDPVTNRDIVRGWLVVNGWAQPLTAAEVFNSYCTDRDGSPVPPQPNTDYCAGFPLDAC